MRRYFPTILLTLLALQCTKPDSPQPPGADEPVPGIYVLPLMETTDMHGHLVDTDASGVIHYQLAYIADKADDIRGHGEERRKERLLLLDGGDLYQGASVSNLLSGWPIFVSLDRMEYDAVALGNHEFDWGVEHLVDADATLPDYEWNGQNYENKIPVLCANLYKDGSRASFTSDYTIVEKVAVGPNGATIPVKIGIVGFAVNYSSSIIRTEFLDKGYSIQADFALANTIATRLETTLGCDATVLLLHGRADESANKLGADTPIDLVLGGHSHQTLRGTTEWGLAYLQGGRYCERYAKGELRFSLDKKGRISFSGVANMSTPEVIASRDTHTTQNADDLSEDILAVSDAAIEATAAQLNEVIGYISTGATSYYLNGSGQRATSMGNWMCDILRRIGGADVAFVNSGGVRTTFPLEGQSRRNITVGDVFEMFPFSNQTYIYSISYQELLDVLEYALTSSGSTLFSYMTGIDCSYRDRSVQTLVQNGITIYSNGQWTGDWDSRSVLLSVSEYLATSQRTDYTTGLSNPLIEWNETDRLLQDELVDNVSAVHVLRTEADASGGKLLIDTAPHFLLQQ